MRLPLAALALAACRRPEPAAAEVAGVAPGPLPADPLRRLTASQYANAVDTLFPGVALPAGLLPSDPPVLGFDGTAAAQVVSDLRTEQLQTAARVAAAAAVDRPERWAPCADRTRACAEDALALTVERAFRRPVTAAEVAPYRDLLREVAAGADVDDGLRVALQAVLLAPEFLYVPELGGDAVGDRLALRPHELATRFALLLWDGPPDDALREAAARGDLDTDAGVDAVVEGMLADPRAARGSDAFTRQWLEVERVRHAAPDPATYPAWDPAFPELLVADQAAFARYAAWEGPGTLAAVLLDRASFADPALAALTGPGPLDPDQRAGALTRPGFLAARSGETAGSPVQRGRSVLERFLCTTLPPPPPGVSADLPPAAPGGSNRDRYAAHAAPACAGCHDPLDGIGFGFEHYDATGAWRDRDGGRPVDATGELVGGDLDGVAYDGALALSERLAASPDVHRCVATQARRFATGRAEDPGAEGAALDDLGAAFFDADGDFRALLADLVAAPAFRTRSPR